MHSSSVNGTRRQIATSPLRRALHSPTERSNSSNGSTSGSRLSFGMKERGLLTNGNERNAWRGRSGGASYWNVCVPSLPLLSTEFVSSEWVKRIETNRQPQSLA